MTRRLVEPLDGATCELTRPVLADPELQVEFDRRGFVVVDLLDQSDVERLVGTYAAAADTDEGVNAPGAYNDTYAEFTVIHSRPAFRRNAFSAIDAVVGPLANAVLRDYRSLVAQFVNKPPGTGVVPAHQNWSVVDETHFQSVSVWIALVDCTVENGTLLLADGSHRALRGRRGMWAYQAFGSVEQDLIDQVLTPVEVRAGQAIILDDAVLHYSAANATDARRLAIQYVMVPAEAEAVFHQQVGEHDGRLEVDVWRVEPGFFFEFWHGDGDADHGEIIDRIEMADPVYDVETIRALLEGSEESPMTQQQAVDQQHPMSQPGAASPTIYRIETVTLDDLADMPTCFADVQNGQLDGVVIKGLFAPDLMAQAVRVMDEHMDGADELTFGAMLGFPLNKCDDSRNEYLAQAEAFVPIHQEVFGFDIRAFLTDVMRRGSGGRVVDVPVEGDRPYTPTTFRIMRPGWGGLKAHTGNEFTQLEAESRGMVWLKPRARMMGCLSWFAVAQPAEVGGELRLADLLWDDTPDELKGFDQNNRDDSFFDELGQDVVALDAGDLIVFAGGRIWHKVSDVGGGRDRVTFGGFAALSQDDERFWYWS